MGSGCSSVGQTTSTKNTHIRKINEEKIWDLARKTVALSQHSFSENVAADRQRGVIEASVLKKVWKELLERNQSDFESETFDKWFVTTQQIVAEVCLQHFRNVIEVI